MMVREKLLDLGNVGSGAMVFGQLLKGAPYSWLRAAGGVTLWLCLAMSALLLTREHTRD